MQTERAEFSGTEAAFDISAIVACQRDRLPSHRGNVTGDIIRNSISSRKVDGQGTC